MYSTRRCSVAPSAILSFVLLALSSGSLPAQLVDFEDWSLEPETAWFGPVAEGQGVEQPGPFGGTDRIGVVESGGVQLVNRYNLDFGSWSGFAVSNQTDNTTLGWSNQASSFAGGGAGAGDDHYAVGFGYVDNLDPTQPEQLAELPFLELPDGASVTSMLVANSTYTALSMLEGDAFSKKFGGNSGTEEDFFRLTAYGVDVQGELLADVVELYLADYRFADNSQDYVVDTWVPLDLSPLTAAKRLYFNLDSTDVGIFGMATPGYFAIDNIVLKSAELAGDFDSDGKLSVEDANLICSAIADGSNPTGFDLDHDLSVSSSDLTVFLGVAKSLAGDANLDGRVAFDDFLSLSGNFGRTGTWSQGDSNCDGRVEFSDFLRLSSNFGGTHSELQAVPEPDYGRLPWVVLSGVLLMRRLGKR